MGNCKEFGRKKKIDIMNCSETEIQSIMELHQKKVDELKEKIKNQKKEINVKKNKIIILKNKINPNPNLIEIKFRLQNTENFSVIIDKSKNLKDVFDKLYEQILDEEYSDINKLYFLYDGISKTDLFINNKPITNLHIKPENPILISKIVKK